MLCSARHEPRTLALIGAGDRGRWHLRALANCERARVVGMSDPVAERPGDLPEEVPFFRSTPDMLHQVRPDFVIMAVPHDAYLDLIAACLEARTPVLQEKPPGRTLDEAMRIEELSRSTGVPICVAAQRRHSQAIAILRQTVSAFGPPRSFSYNYHVALPALRGEWRLSRNAAGGGALLDMGYHVIDLLTDVCGPPENVSGHALWHEGHPDLEHAVNLLLSYRSGGSGVISLGWFFRPRAERATFWWDDFSLAYANDGDLVRHAEGSAELLATAESRADLLHQQIHAFLDHLEGRPSATCTIKEAVTTMAVMQRCQAAVAREPKAGKAVA